MKVLIIGSGGREHALAWKLARSPRRPALYASPGSAALARLATCVPLDGPDAICDFAEREGIDLTVVGPEAPLVAGLADRMAERGLRVFGPSRAAAALEGSKAFAKAFMARQGIPTASFNLVTSLADGLAVIDREPGPYVVKADGLTAGKGVSICDDRESARAALTALMADRVFGEAGAQVVLEGFMTGEEASYFVITDGEAYVAFPPAQDYKRIGEGDQGPNTGGMGAYCPAPVVTPEVERRVLREIVEPTLRGMAAEGNPYRGVLYVGLMIADGRPQVVEYNCRFGDPECQPLMLMLESDLLPLLEGAAGSGLAVERPRWRTGASACIVMASEGYPGSYPTGVPIAGLDGAPAAAACVFHAGTAHGDAGWVTAGGRVLGVTAWGEDLQAALAQGYAVVGEISWKGATYRKDIGWRGLRRHEG